MMAVIMLNVTVLCDVMLSAIMLHGVLSNVNIVGVIMLCCSDDCHYAECHYVL
jgi:hypothetical protein